MTQSAPRRDMWLAALVSSVPIGFAETAAASPLNPSQTIIRPPGRMTRLHECTPHLRDRSVLCRRVGHMVVQQ
jgi:hypothetical protein